MTFWTELKNFFEGLASFGNSVKEAVTLIPKYFSYMITAFSHLPWFISGTVILVIGFAVVRLIIGLVDFLKP